MKHYIEVEVWEPDAEGHWSRTVATNRDHNPIEVTTEDEVVFCGGDMQPGLMWDSERVEELLRPYIGCNGLGEAMWMCANETNSREGHYMIDAQERREGHEAHDDEGDFSGCKPCVVTWQIMGVISTNRDLIDAVRRSEAPRPLIVEKDEDTRYEKSYNRSNETWRVTKWTKEDDEWQDDHIATLDTETLADLLIMMCEGVTLYIGVEEGLVEALTVPAELLYRINAKVVDFDVQSDKVEDINGGVAYTNESGEDKVCSVLDTQVRCENGADEIDRAIQASRK